MLTTIDKNNALAYAETALKAEGGKTYSTTDTVRKIAYENACRVKNEEFLEILQFALAITSTHDVGIQPLEYLSQYSSKEERAKVIKQLGLEDSYKLYESEIKEVIATVKNKVVVSK